MKKKNNNWKKAFISSTILSLGTIATACTICLLTSCNKSNPSPIKNIDAIEATTSSSIIRHEKITTSDIKVIGKTSDGTIAKEDMKWNEDYSIAVEKDGSITTLIDFGTNGYTLDDLTTKFIITYIKNTKITTTLSVDAVDVVDPLKITATTKTSMLWTNSGLASSSLSYSVDNGANWQKMTSGKVVTIGESGTQNILLRGNLYNYSTSETGGEYFNNIKFTKDNDVEATVVISGSIMGLVNNGQPITSLPTNLFLPLWGLFQDSTALYKIDESETTFLPFSDLTTFKCSYGPMFSGCSALINTPKLIATKLYSWCYTRMFSNCKSITTAPELPVTTLTDYCYAGMFEGTSITTAPELPAPILTYCCYDSMFYGCTSLTTAPELPATTLSDECYNSMFSGCTALKTVPSNMLPAKVLTKNCYAGMFSRTSITTAPELPAKELAVQCYNQMFSYCSSLTVPPELPATTLPNYCYYFMFWYCSKLKINDTGTTGTKFFTCPATFGDYAVVNMFSFTGGSYSKNPVANGIYYYE